MSSIAFTVLALAASGYLFVLAYRAIKSGIKGVSPRNWSISLVAKLGLTRRMAGVIWGVILFVLGLLLLTAGSGPAILIWQQALQ